MPSQTAAPPQQQQQLLPGSRFSIPPYTDEVEQPENNDQLTTNLSAQSQVPVTGVIPFMQSDIIYGWVYEVSPAHTQTDGTGTGIAISQYAPWIVLGPVLLNMQYQYPSISVASGIDLSLINGYRPLVEANRGIAHYKSPITDSPSSQANQNYTTYTHNTGVAQTPTMDFELPAAVWFDSYYELDETGMPVSGPHNGFVSPQNMGGYARVVTPSIRLNPVFSTLNDSGMYYYTTLGTASIAGAVATHGFSRIGVLGSLDQSVLPQPTNWQYNIAHQQVTIAGVSKASIPLNGIFAGQIMSICCRMFDPAVASGGAPIPVANVTNYQLQYGGSVQRFAGGQGTSIKRLQRRFMEQHLYLPMEGVMILDLAVDRYLGVTNSYCLNTLRTAAVQLNLIFSGAQSASAYIEVTIEGLRWVPLPVNPAQ
jgi:hypothetical protein